MEKNQCDGCQAGKPVDEKGLHRMGEGRYFDYMLCQADKYKEEKKEKGR